MKTIITLLVITASFFVAPQAEARDYHHLSRKASCGCPIKYQKVFYGYDTCGTPIFRYHRMPVRHRCHLKKKRYSHGYRHHRSRRSHYGFRYDSRGGGYSFRLRFQR